MGAAGAGLSLGGLASGTARRVSATPLPLVIVAVVVLGTIGFALFSVRRIKMDPQQYMVGGRSFGTIFLWVLLAGEIYTTFTFWESPDSRIRRARPPITCMAYGVCAYLIGYFLAPAIWRVAKDANLLTGDPTFSKRVITARALGVAVALLWFAMIVPCVRAAFRLADTAADRRVWRLRARPPRSASAFVVLALFVFTAGLRRHGLGQHRQRRLRLGRRDFCRHSPSRCASSARPPR